RPRDMGAWAGHRGGGGLRGDRARSSGARLHGGDHPPGPRRLPAGDAEGGAELRARLPSPGTAARALPHSRGQGASTSSVKVPGTTLGRGWGCSAVAAGAGPRSAVTVYRRWVLWSSAIVRAPRRVGTVAITRNAAGLSSWTTVMLPSPLEAKARPVVGSNAAPSTPSPIGSVATTLPAAASEMAISRLR